MNRRILIVDDEAVVGESLKAALKTAGYTAKVARDGLEGVRLLKQQSFDLLLLDLNLPTLTGWDVLDLVMNELPMLPVVVLTGLLHQCEPEALAGVDAVLEKPPDVPFLFQLIEHLLQESTAERLRRRARNAATTLWVSAAAHRTRAWQKHRPNDLPCV